MATAEEIAAPLLAAMQWVPDAFDTACTICHSSTAGWPQCYPCKMGSSLLGVMPAVLPITMSIERGQVHHALREYKDGFDQKVRDRFAWQLAAVLKLFTDRHSDCIGD